MGVWPDDSATEARDAPALSRGHVVAHTYI